MTESAHASEEHTRTTLKGPTAAACGCCVCGWRAHIRASARAGRYERRRARRSRAACGHTHARTHSIVSFYYRQPSSFVCVPKHSLCQRARRPATAAAPRRAVRRPAGRRPEFSESDKAAHNRGLCVPNLGAVDPVLAVRRVHPPARVVDPARREVRPAARRLRALRGRALRLRVGGRHAAEHRAGAQ